RFPDDVHHLQLHLGRQREPHPGLQEPRLDLRLPFEAHERGGDRSLDVGLCHARAEVPQQLADVVVALLDAFADAAQFFARVVELLRVERGLQQLRLDIEISQRLRDAVVQFLRQQVALLRDRHLFLTRDQTLVLDRDAQVPAERFEHELLLRTELAQCGEIEIEQTEVLAAETDWEYADRGETLFTAAQGLVAVRAAHQNMDAGLRGLNALATQALIALEAALRIGKCRRDAFVHEQMQLTGVRFDQAHGTGLGIEARHQLTQEIRAQRFESERLAE